MSVVFFEKNKTFRVAVLGATGAVGCEYLRLLAHHPFFMLTAVAASSKSKGKQLVDVCSFPVPKEYENLVLLDAEKDADIICARADFVFCAVGGAAQDVRALEEKYAKMETPVVSNNAAQRMLLDVPMVIPELNPNHLDVIPLQKRRLGTRRGFVVCKANCSLQSYLPFLFPLQKFALKRVWLTTMQSSSGAGKRIEQIDGLQGNILPHILGEEEKCETEPLKILGSVENNGIQNANSPAFYAKCCRVPVFLGHTASVFFELDTPPNNLQQIIEEWKNFSPSIYDFNLPSAPKRFLVYNENQDRPQPLLDKSVGGGMSVCAGNLTQKAQNLYHFIGVSHNLLRGAAGGAILLAELLVKTGYL